MGSPMQNWYHPQQKLLLLWGYGHISMNLRAVQFDRQVLPEVPHHDAMLDLSRNAK